MLKPEFCTRLIAQGGQTLTASLLGASMETDTLM